VAARCREVGALLIVDEVQTGCGRTGRFLALEHFGLEPDLVCLAKALGGGVPIGVVVAGHRVRGLPPRIHSSTFGGNPLACAAAHAVLEVIEEEGLPARAAALGERFRDRMQHDAPAVIRHVRGRGLMIGIELKRKAGPVLAPLAERGVLALLAGNSVLRLLPPLVISEEELDRVADRVIEVLHDAS
jgi:acetylornithine/LysW-gamma-L-lysine aminotransferase